MRCLLALLGLVALGGCNSGRQAADQQLLNKQQDVMQLLQKITTGIPNQQLQNLGASYDIESNSQLYNNPIIVKYYAGAVKAGLVQPKGTVFSSTVTQLRKEVSLLYRILAGAQDYQTFMKTAAWARVHVNEGQYIKALIAAILTRQDTQGIILPPSYEILPQLHLDSRIIQEAQQASSQGIQQGIQNVLIPVNYSALLAQDEQQLSYFTQDVGLGNYYGYLNLVKDIESEQQQQQQQQPLTQQQYQQQIVGKYLQQKGQEQQNINGHGAKYLYLHQQLLAHYELNRLSNGLGPIQNIDYTSVNAPFQPHLRNLNGLELPARPENLQLQPQKNELIQHVQKLEQRLMEAVESGHVITPQGIFLSLYQPQGVSILGDLIEGCGKSVNPRYYGSLEAAARKLLGNAPESQNIWDYTPSALELGQTAVRDPAFYQLYKRIINLHQRYQKSLPAYQSNDLILPGVIIQNVDVSQLVTLFTDFFIDLDAVTVPLGQSQQQQQVQQQHQQQQAQQQQQVQQQVQQQIKAHLKRLDHKPFQYQISVHSEQSVPNAIVRIFLGPKHDYQGRPISISHSKQLFVELDQFVHNLPQGQTVIIRNSQQAPVQSHDWPSAQQIQQGVNGAIRSQEPFYITEPQQIFSFPARLALPKGQPQGYPLQLLVVISGPGPLNVPSGPVIPEENLAFQNQEFQIINPEQYEQLKQQQQQQRQGQSQKPGIQQNVEVLPGNWVPAQQQIQAVRNHYANVYTKYHGQYPHSQIYNPVGQGEDVSDTIQGVGEQFQRQQPLQVIQAQPIQQFQQQRQLELVSLVTRGRRVTRQVFQQDRQGPQSFGLGTSITSVPSQGGCGQGFGLGSSGSSVPSQSGCGQGFGLGTSISSVPSQGEGEQGFGIGTSHFSQPSQGDCGQGFGLGSSGSSMPSQGGCGQGFGLGSSGSSVPSQSGCGQGFGLGTSISSVPSQGDCGQGFGLGSSGSSMPSQAGCGQGFGLGSSISSVPSQSGCGQGFGLGTSISSVPSQGGCGQGFGLGSSISSVPSQGGCGQGFGLGTSISSVPSQNGCGQGFGLGPSGSSMPSQAGCGQGFGLGSSISSVPSQSGCGQGFGLGSSGSSMPSQAGCGQGFGLGSSISSVPSQSGCGQGFGLGTSISSVPSQSGCGQGFGLGTSISSMPSQGGCGQGFGLGSSGSSVPSQAGCEQGFGLGTSHSAKPSQVEDEQGFGIGTSHFSQPSQVEGEQGFGIGTSHFSQPSQGEGGERFELGSSHSAEPSQDEGEQGFGLGTSHSLQRSRRQAVQDLEGLRSAGLGTSHYSQSSQVPDSTLDQSVLVGQVSSGQLHNGGFQGIYAQPQTIQDPSVSEYHQKQQVSQSIGGAISLDGKPLGFPLDRPLTPGALSVPNIFVKDVLVFHEGQPTNDIIQ